MIPCRTITHALVRVAGFGRFALRKRLVSAFMTCFGYEAPRVMDVATSRECTRTSRQHRKQGGDHKYTHPILHFRSQRN
jgi:hypothetical protein